MTTQRERDVRVDALRGLMLVIMTIDHFPDILSMFTRESLGYVSAAEGFVFLSGFVAGRVYGRYLFERGEAFMKERAHRRVAVIYGYHLASFTLLLIIAAAGIRLDELNAAAPLFYTRPFLALLLGAALIYQPYMFFILPLYCLFVAAIPFLLKYLRRGKLTIILLVSAILWLVGQSSFQQNLEAFLSHYLPVRLGLFHILSWQLLFTAGIVLGFPAQTKRTFPSYLTRLLFPTALVVGTALFLCRHGVFQNEKFLYYLESFTSKNALGPVRVLNFAIVAFVVGRTVRYVPITTHVRVFAYLGRNSLAVFTAQVVAYYLLMDLFTGGQMAPELANLVRLFVCFCALFLVTFIMETIRNRNRISLKVNMVGSPVATAVTAPEDCTPMPDKSSGQSDRG